MTATIVVDTGVLRTMAEELERLTGSTVTTPLGPGVAGPPSTRRSSPLDYLAQYFHVSPDTAGWNLLFADIVTYVEGRGADFAVYLRDIATALMQSGTNLRVTAGEYETVNEDQRSALDKIAGAAFGAPGKSKSLPAEGVSIGCVREPMSQMFNPPSWEGPSGNYGLVEKILTIDYFSPSALVRQGIQEVFDIDPLELVTKCFAGDWSQVGRASAAAEALAWYFRGVGDQVANVVDAGRVHWSGNAADSAFAYLERLAKGCWEASVVAGEVGSKLEGVSNAMLLAAEEVAGLFTDVIDCITGAIITTGLGAATAETVVGPALAAFIDALLLNKAFQAAAKAIKRTQEVVERVKEIVDLMKQLGASAGQTGTARIPLPGAGQ